MVRVNLTAEMLKFAFYVFTPISIMYIYNIPEIQDRLYENGASARRFFDTEKVAKQRIPLPKTPEELDAALDFLQKEHAKNLADPLRKDAPSEPGSKAPQSDIRLQRDKVALGKFW